jgi:hypothetical protein
VGETAAGLSVPVDIRPVASTLTDADLRAAGVDDLEVQRMPAGSNPSWVSRRQWDLIEPLLGEQGRAAERRRRSGSLRRTTKSRRT